MGRVRGWSLLDTPRLIGRGLRAKQHLTT